VLHSLHIRNYILIDALDVTFPEGLVIITGQTGAGKSILLGALSLLSGARADASLITEGADSCVVEAEFAGADADLRGLLTEADVEEDGDRLLVRRVLSRSGRSRCFINDCPVPLSLMQDVAGRLVDIHSQHKSLLLTDAQFQLSVLDRFAANDRTLADCREAWRSWQGLLAELAAAREEQRRLEADRDFNEAQWRQLDGAKLSAGELEALEEEQRGLANAEQIKDALGRCRELLLPEGESPGVSVSLKEAARQLEHIVKYMPAAAQLPSRLESARIELDDICAEIEALDERVDLSPARLEAVEERMSLLYSLMKKHHCAEVDELIAVREHYAGLLAGTTASEDRILELEAASAEAGRRYGALAAALSKARRAAAPHFAAAITESLRYLELERAVFELSLSDAPQGPSGADRVSFLFSATGRNAVDVAKCASGGELSRIMLSLKAMMAKYFGMPTLIFDEIDTGVSGSVADKMGRMICEMGRDMQVFSITHLPQVAAKGDAHFVVSKSVQPDGRTVSTVSEVQGEERTMEIARLLSGATVTPAAVANAKALLAER